MNKKIFCTVIVLVVNFLAIVESFAALDPNPGTCQYSSGNKTKELIVPTDMIKNSNVGDVTTSINRDYVGVNAICMGSQLAESDNTTYRSYITSLPQVSVENSYKFLRLNEYLAIGMSIMDDAYGVYYPPGERLHMGKNPAVKKHEVFPVADSNLIYKFKVLKSFAGSVTIPYTVIFDVYIGADMGSVGEPKMMYVVYQIVMPSVTITVPSTCVVNAGAIIDFNFSDISASSFSRAGAGNKPTDVATQSKSFGISCSDANARSALKLTLQTPSASGKTILSSNSDLGFIITDDSDKVIIPNDATSTINTTLDSTSAATVTIKAYPVSVTGNRPAEGMFSATAYLFVDYA